MRLNRYLARATGLSRRAADAAIAEHRVLVDGRPPSPGLDVSEDATVTLDDKPVKIQPLRTVLLNKPAGYVVSRDGQGSPTVYELLPPELHHLKPVGRLDKDSSGLLLLTNDGGLADQLTHPRYGKDTRYEVTLHRPLTEEHRVAISKGIPLDDGTSALRLSGESKEWLVIMREGRNRQIRRTFAACGYTVVRLHRRSFGPYILDGLATGKWSEQRTTPEAV